MARFSDLPPEIRCSIWLLTIPDDEEEVCLLWPGNEPGAVGAGQSPLTNVPALPLTVDTSFALAMHICRESRAVALDPTRGGVRLRASHVARCMTPFRCFRPELDVLYLDQESVFHIDLLMRPQQSRLPLTRPGTSERRCFEAFMDILCRTRRYAVPVASALEEGFLSILCYHLTYHAEMPLALSVILPFSTPYTWQGKDGPSLFIPPAKRCRLIDVPLASLDNDALVMPVKVDPYTAVTAKQAVADVRRLLDKQGEDGPMEQAMVNGLGLRTQVFVEHQSGGVWHEACRDRMYDRGRHCSSRVSVPLSRRPNPELVRVHDTDAVFWPVPSDWGAPW